MNTTKVGIPGPVYYQYYLFGKLFEELGEIVLSDRTAKTIMDEV